MLMGNLNLEIYIYIDTSDKIKDTLNYLYTVWKVSKYGVFFGPHFPAFGLNTDQK